ncbi:hypothetical protein AB0C69_35470, partial [Actinomadura sp. NPDC048032]
MEPHHGRDAADHPAGAGRVLPRPARVHPGRDLDGSEGLKLTVIGGGSTYTPELVDGLARAHAALPVSELVLADPDARRLELVGGLSARMLAR